MKINRIMIAAPKSGSGKTTVTCAFLQALKDEGRQAVSFKCGPDYIDPMFHEKALKVPSKNLDTFFTGEDGTRELFLNHGAGADIAVLEGVMGLYDGLGGIREEGSSYHLAKVTKTPIVLVIDAKGMGRSVIPMLAGFLLYDKHHLIKGVILNKVSRGYYEMIKPLIEAELKLTVAGFLPQKEECRMDCRHLGLVLPDELHDIQEKLRRAAEELKKNVSLKELVSIAGQAQELGGCVKTDACGTKPRPGAGTPGVLCKREAEVALAVARDEAFCFYYEDNIRLLEENGAAIRYFSPLFDKELPKGCHGLLLGGGYPELYAKRLSENGRMRRAVKAAAKQGMPIVAECGGFMYLHEALTDQDGGRYEMCGVIPADCFYTGKLTRFGYVTMREKQNSFLPPGAYIKGHEFHYYDSTMNGAGVTAVKPATGKEYPCVITGENRWMGFPHLYYPSNPAFARSFAEKAARYQHTLENGYTKNDGKEDSA